jgi:hypothetical protein
MLHGITSGGLDQSHHTLCWRRGALSANKADSQPISEDVDFKDGVRLALLVPSPFQEKNKKCNICGLRKATFQPGQKLWHECTHASLDFIQVAKVKDQKQKMSAELALAAVGAAELCLTQVSPPLPPPPLTHV